MGIIFAEAVQPEGVHNPLETPSTPALRTSPSVATGLPHYSCACSVSLPLQGTLVLEPPPNTDSKSSLTNVRPCIIRIGFGCTLLKSCMGKSAKISFWRWVLQQGFPHIGVDLAGRLFTETTIRIMREEYG